MAVITVPLSTPVARRLALLEGIALEGSRTRPVVELARSLCAQAQASGAPAWWWLRPLVAVQGLPIVGDRPGVDEYRDVLTTLSRGGDCANKAALLVALYLAARPFCGEGNNARVFERARIVWEHCGTSCAFDHVRVDLRVNGETWLLDALQPVSPGARAVSWPVRNTWPGRWL